MWERDSSIIIPIAVLNLPPGFIHWIFSRFAKNSRIRCARAATGSTRFSAGIDRVLTIVRGRGFHVAACEEQLLEPLQPVFLHHFPFRKEETTRQRLDLLWSKNDGGIARATDTDDATGHMLPRFRSLDAVYQQEWARVEQFIPNGIRTWRDAETLE